MKPSKEKKAAQGRIDSRAAVASARSIQKTIEGIDGTYDEMIEKSPFSIRPARELLDSSPDLNLEKSEKEAG